MADVHPIAPKNGCCAPLAFAVVDIKWWVIAMEHGLRWLAVSVGYSQHIQDCWILRVSQWIHEHISLGVGFEEKGASFIELFAPRTDRQKKYYGLQLTRDLKKTS